MVQTKQLSSNNGSALNTDCRTPFVTMFPRNSINRPYLFDLFSFLVALNSGLDSLEVDCRDWIVNSGVPGVKFPLHLLSSIAGCFFP